MCNGTRLVIQDIRSKVINLLDFQKIMEKISLKYSLKDIPIPRKETYIKLLFAKTNSFIRRIRWKVYYADKKNVNELNKDKMNEMKKNFKA